jgi:glycerol kinase
VFDAEGGIVAVDQHEHTQIMPQPGWVEHDALEIWGNTCAVIFGALAKAGIELLDLAAVSHDRRAFLLAQIDLA